MRFRLAGPGWLTRLGRLSAGVGCLTGLLLLTGVRRVRAGLCGGLCGGLCAGLRRGRRRLLPAVVLRPGPAVRGIG
ncbi:hypothetical protein, partial [Streptomyces griseolus]|uniref:hypothetical protein n=1 Tax=Streptomyces griseolus TaxID=1909 RepID=UPI002243BF29